MTPISDHRCELGEGALWHPERGEFFWFDITGGTLQTATQTWVFSEMASAAGWVDRDRLFIASETQFFTLDLTKGAQDHVCALNDDRSLRSNDGRADRQGGFWIGTMSKDKQPRAGAIWRFYRGELRKLFPGLSIPNAICFAPDGKSACFTDTPTGQVMRVALDAQGWPVGDPECWLDLRAEGLNPDGAVFDAEGNFWVAQWGAGRVAAYAPDGDFLRAVEFPAPHTSCPAFGGVDLSDLYCTTAREGRDPPGPLDGATFCAPGIARGLPEPRVVLEDA